LLHVLTELLETEQNELTNRRLEASDFNKLISNDTDRDLLSWMNNSEQCQSNWNDLSGKHLWGFVIRNIILTQSKMVL